MEALRGHVELVMRLVVRDLAVLVLLAYLFVPPAQCGVELLARTWLDTSAPWKQAVMLIGHDLNLSRSARPRSEATRPPGK
jgi:antibiotic biosynthesis monooxygenase (ABM) superfamily enzyme